MSNIQPSNVPTFNLGLIGFLLDHSLSPAIHRAALRACGLQGDYSLYSIQPDDSNGLTAILASVRAGEIHGLNVTIPHKQDVIPLLDELTPAAQAIGAVNTIYLRGGKLIGDNTDAAGFLSDLNKFPRNHQSSIVLGAGGSARAVVHALLNDGWTVTVAARRIEQAQELADSFPNYQLPITSLQTFEPSTFNLMVNATPVGMWPNLHASPLPENIALPKDLLIYDLIYNPRETKLVKDARAQGLSAATGLGMLVEQAALAFEIWTGRNPPRAILRRAAED